MTQVIDLIKDALGEIGEYEIPEFYVDNPNPTAMQALALANREGRSLARRHGWERLTTIHTFSTVASQADYALPSDFDRFVSGTWWDRSNYWELNGPASPVDWQRLKSGQVNAGVRRWFTMMGNKFYLDPTPTASGDTISFIYQSNSWCESAAGVAQVKILADTDVLRVPEEAFRLGIKWRFLKEKGLPSDLDLIEYEREVQRSMARDGGMPKLRMDYQKVVSPELAVNIQEGNFG